MKLLGGIISPFLESIDFVTGMMGAGMSFSSEKGGESVGWIDKLYVRKKAIFQLLSIMETELAGASFMFNASGARATITKVEFIEKKGIRFKDGKGVKFSDGKRGYSSPGTYGSVYRCYFLADDGEFTVPVLQTGHLLSRRASSSSAGTPSTSRTPGRTRIVTL